MTIDYSESFIGAKRCLKDFENHIDNNRLDDARESCEQAMEHFSAIIGWIDDKQGVHKEDADGWIEWKGGECPVPKNKTVDYKMKMHWIGTQFATCKARFLRWNHIGLDGDIIAYRIAK